LGPTGILPVLFFDDLQREPAGVFWGMKSVIAAGVTVLVAASAALADTPVKGSPQPKEKVTEQTVFVTGSLIPQRIKVRHVGTKTVSPISVVDRAAIDATGRQTAAGFLVNEPSVRIIGH
jgi:hypothetical protein